MKTKKKRVGSFLCFSPPPTTDEGEKTEKRERSPKFNNLAAETEASQRKSQRRAILKIIKSTISINSSSSDRSLKLRKDASSKLSPNASDSSYTQSGHESFGESLDFSPYFSSSSSSASSSSCLSCGSACLSATEPRLKPSKKTSLLPSASKRSEYATGLSVVLLSLFAMVFYGRLCAILWTATWLCLAPRRRPVAKLPEFDDVAAGRRRRREFREDERKRILLKGFLQRNRKGVS